MALTDNLQAYWKFDESSGNASDSTGNGYTMTNNGTATYTAGLINNAATLGTSNTTKYFTNATGIGTSGNGSLSISFWVKLTTEIAAGTYVLAEVDSQTGADRYAVCQYEYNAGTPRLGWNCGGNAIYYTVTLGTSNWYHVVCLRTTTTATELYVNNTSRATGTPGTGTEGAANSSFGADAFNANNKASAIFDEAGVWSKVLTSTEISQLYNNGNGFSYPFSTTSRRALLLGIGS